jgi:hypothetical protein
VRSFSSFLKIASSVALLAFVSAGVARSQSASFTGFDTATKGSWVGAYGQDGYIIANGANQPPGYASVGFASASSWTWVASTTDVRALYGSNSVSSSRIASTYYSGSTFTIDINFSDSQPHQVALYSLDLDTTSRSQTFTVVNATTNAVLDGPRSLSNFSNGAWAVWNITGHTAIRVTNQGSSLNAVVSGVFFRSFATVPPPSVTMNTPAQNPITGPVTLTATATSSASITSVQFQSDGASLGAPVTSGSGSTYSFQWTNPTNGAHQLTAVANDSQGQSATSAPVSVTVSLATSSGGNSASFIKTDTTTKGNWIGTYGGDGYIIPNDATSLPSYASESTIGAASYTWLAQSTSDSRTLFTGPSSSTRIASTFYTASNTSFSFDINLSDGLQHQLAIYCLDYETNSRSQTINILDGATNNVLNTQSLAGMSGGTYAVWNVSGHVIVRVTYTGGLNAVVAGVFFGGAPVATPLPTVTLTAPSAGNVSGSVNVTSTASSPVGIASVQYYLDGQVLGSPQTIAPYSYSWNTAGASNGSHTLTAIATDTQSQKSAASPGVTVNVSNAATPPPTITITNPTGTVSGTVSIQATANATSPATMSSVQFQIDGSALATVNGSGPGFSTSWDTTTASNATHTLTAIATDSLNHTATTTVSVTVANTVSSTNTATFVKTDSTTSGSWPGKYGSDGYVIANSSSSLPSYLASFTPSASAATYTWVNPSSDTRALFTGPSSGTRIASTYYSSTSFSFDLNFRDSAPHQIALYSLDIEPSGRAQTISILDGSTNAVLSAAVPLASFGNGIWAVWNVSGHVIVKVVSTGNLNGVVSGVFFGAPPVLPAPPTVSILTPAANSSVTGSVSLTASASATATSVQYFLGTTSLGTSTTGSSFSLNWDTTNVSNGPYSLTAVASDSYGQKGAASTAVSVTVSNPVLPSISITSPTAGSVSGKVFINVNATSANGMSSVQFLIDSTPLATVQGAGPTYTTTWDTTTLTNGSHTITAIATDQSNKTKSANVTVTISNAVASSNTATFIKSDAATSGNWVGVYGADGYIIPNDASNPPAYATVSSTGASPYSWQPVSTDTRALYTSPAANSRIGSTYYSFGSFTFDINCTDGQLHQLALYFLDLDTTTRSESIQVLNADTNALLDSQTIANFSGGVYEVWNVTGHVLIRVTNTGTPNAVLSGIFFRSFAGLSSPVVTFNAPTNNQTLSGAVTFSVNASSAQGIASVQFQIDGVNAGAAVTGAGPVFTSLWASPQASDGSHTASAVVTDNVGLRSVATVPVQISNGPAPTPSAVLTSIDSYSSGSWKGVYGQDGEIIAVDSTNPPFYATVNFINTINPPFTWHAGNPTTDVPGLQKANSNQRIGAAFYQIVGNNQDYSKAQFTIDVNFVDYQKHELSLYFVDWHHPVRAQTIKVMNANTNAVLDTQNLTNFPLGVYYTWNIQGHVLINIQLTPTQFDPDSAVVSGLFFQSASTVARPTVSVNAPTPNQTVSQTVSISATASSAIGMTSVQFELDSYPLGSPVTVGSPYVLQWNTTGTANGIHTLNAVAIDSSGHAITSPPITVVVLN